MPPGVARGARFLRGIALFLLFSTPVSGQSTTGIRECVAVDADSLPGAILRVSLSPDGVTAALETEQSGSRRIFLYDLLTKHVTPIDPRLSTEGYAEWRGSPLALMYDTREGDLRWNPAHPEWMAFVSNGLENRDGVWLYDLLTGRYLFLSDPGVSCTMPRWSPDGNRIAYMRESNGSRSFTILKDISDLLQTGVSLRVCPQYPGAFAPQFSPSSFAPVAVPPESSEPVPFWNGSQEFLLALREDSSRTRYMLQRCRMESGAAWKEPLWSDSLTACAAIPRQNLLAAGEWEARDGKAELALYSLRTGQEKTLPQTAALTLEQGEKITQIDPLAPALLLGLVARGESARARFFLLSEGRVEKRDIPAFDSLVPEHATSLRMAAVMPAGSGSARMIVTYETGMLRHICFFSAAVPISTPSVRNRSYSALCMGAGGGTAQYSGQAGSGDYRPHAYFDMEAEPARPSPVYWKIGLEGGYADIAKTVSTSLPFTRSYAYAEAYTILGYRFGALAPFLTARIGKGLVNLYYPSGSRRMPNHFGWGAGADLAVSPRVSIRLTYLVRTLNLDLARNAGSGATDRFSGMTAGLYFYL